MGSLRLNRSDMDGDSTSPFSSQKIEQIKKILHKDVDKELEQAIKIAKEINSRIYQVHRNILVYQKLNPTRKVVFTKNKAAERENYRNDDVLGEGSLSETSCSSSKLDDVLQRIKTEPVNEPSSSETSITGEKLPCQSSCQNLSSKETLEKNESNQLCSKVCTDERKSFNFTPCSKCLASKKESGQNGNKTIYDFSNPNASEKDASNEIRSQSNSISEAFVSETVSDKCAEIANSLWPVCLDHDYLAVNVWAEQIKHRRSFQPYTSGEKAEVSVVASASCSSIIGDSSPPRKRIKIESATDSESSSVTPQSVCSPKSALSDSVLSNLGINDVKYDDFVNSSSYFDEDLVIFDANPFSFNNIDLSSVCDIPCSNWKSEYGGQTNQTISSLEPVQDNISNHNKYDSTIDSLNKSNSSGNNTLNGASPVKLRFTIGTVSKLLLASEKSCHETHIWKIYVRNTFVDDPPLDDYIAKIRFVIHDSYAPNNLIERKEPPYEISRRGWGEFPIRVQIFFRFNKKPICLVHQLSLVRNVINILTLGIQKNYEMVIPNLIKNIHPAKESDSSAASGTPNDDQRKNSKCDLVGKDMFDFKIKEIDTVAKINELISQDTVPNVNNTKKSDEFHSPSSPTLLFKELKSQLLGERDFYTNFSDLNQMKVLTSSIKNYCERILFLLEILPIVTPYALLKWYRRVYPYTCPNKKIFDSWPIGKQRASEFGRARMVKSLAASNSAEDWSTNEIVLFARNKDDQFRNDPVSKASLISFAKSVALQQLSELENQLANSECSEVIDVV